MMKRLLLVCALAAVVSLAHGVEPGIHEADLRVGYAYSYLLPHKKVHATCRMELLLGSSMTKFFEPVGERLDSLDSSPEGRKVLREMAMNALVAGNIGDVPRKKAGMYVFHDIAASRAVVFQDMKVEKAFYEEPWPEFEWQLSDSTKSLLGYECQLAEADFRGRHWKAWFAPGIAVSAGPWKLGGLPGLILEAYDSTGQHRFTADGIEKVSMPINWVYNAGEYAKSDRKSVLRQTWKVYDDPVAALRAQGIKVVRVDNSGDSTHTDEVVSDLIETDWR